MARFGYYNRLNKAQKATYRASDDYDAVVLDDPAALRPQAAEIEAALRADDRIMVERHAHRFVRAICTQLRVDWPSVRVEAERPRDDGGELYGLYLRDDEERPRILVWMRTAAHERPVAFKTFLRTLLHEVVHHLDYELLELDDSFHTHGFFQRESSLFRALRPGAARNASPTVEKKKEPKQKEQLELF